MVLITGKLPYTVVLTNYYSVLVKTLEGGMILIGSSNFNGTDMVCTE